MLSQFAQPAVLAALPPCGRSLVFRLNTGADARAALAGLVRSHALDHGAVGIGPGLAAALGHVIPGLHGFPAATTPAGALPSTQGDLWFMLRGGDRATVFDRAQALEQVLAPAFTLVDAVDTFAYGGRDLTGYVDGTENPKGRKRTAATLVAKGALAGSSFVAVQRWVHDLAAFHRHSPAERDAMIGRTQAEDEELGDAPDSAHVKRTAQEDFDPEAFMFRRSMPWAEGRSQGLEFIAYARSLDPFEQIMRRMSGQEDGIVDALFIFSTPVTGGYYWCPPVRDGRLDLAALGV